MRAYAPDPAPYRADRAPDWLDEIDLSLGGGPVRMGTRALPEERWLPPDHLAPSEVALRRRLLAEQRTLVLACTDRAAAPAEEAAALIDDWRAAHTVTGSPVAEEDPLARAGSSGQDDLCLMVHHDGAWRLEGAVLCFPSLWVLAEKLGRPAAGIHEPVPHYAEELAGRVDTFLDRLAPGKVVWRRNFSLWPALLLWAPCHSLDTSLHDGGPGPDGTPNWWIRSERQTLRRLPETGAILFTIRVQMVPMSVLRDRADRAADLAQWFVAPHGATRRQQMGDSFDGVLSWLRHTAGHAP